MHDAQFSWLPFSSLGEAPVGIKEEPSESSYPLLSPPDTPSLSPSVTNLLPSTLCRRRSLSLAGTKRVRPYPSSKRGSSRTEESGIMSNTPSCEWSISGTRTGNGRSHPSAQRRSPDSDAYPLGQQFIPETFVGHMTTDPSDMRPMSSSSSLTNAMGDTNMSTHSRHSRSPSQGDVSYNVNMNQNSAWPSSSQLSAQQIPISVPVSAYTGLGNMPFPTITSQDLSTNNLPYHDYNPTTHRNHSPDSLSSGSPAFTQSIFSDPYALSTRGQPARTNSSSYPIAIQNSSYHCGSDSSLSSEERLESEVIHLRRKVRELEAECNKARSVLQATRGTPTASGYSLPSPLPTPPQSSSFQTSWKARTQARDKLFCSLNRAGNALCAWHDSRRERRAYPPRNAPPGYLNCGCTHEEALFEESLSRHGVGSYHPGETVRMDPALRNPLLKLLQQRYGYRDGDFERDPITGEWVEGEGPVYWEQQAQLGPNVRKRGDTDRH